MLAADTVADRPRWLPSAVFPADGERGGPQRNSRMVEAALADCVIAFTADVDRKGSTATDCWRKAKRAVFLRGAMMWHVDSDADTVVRVNQLSPSGSWRSVALQATVPPSAHLFPHKSKVAKRKRKPKRKPKLALKLGQGLGLGLGLELELRPAVVTMPAKRCRVVGGVCGGRL
jgi:hypothetical protein